MNIKMRELLKQAQQMQEKLHEQLASLVGEGSVGGGMVTAKMNGHKELLEIAIDTEVIDPEDPGMLQDLVVAAVNEASRKVDEIAREKVGSMASTIPNFF